MQWNIFLFRLSIQAKSSRVPHFPSYFRILALHLLFKSRVWKNKNHVKPQTIQEKRWNNGWRSEVRSFSCVPLFATPWTVAYQAPLSMRFSQARILEWATIPFSRGVFPTQGSNPPSPALQADSLLSEPPGKPGPCVSWNLKPCVSLRPTFPAGIPGRIILCPVAMKS